MDPSTRRTVLRRPTHPVAPLHGGGTLTRNGIGRLLWNQVGIVRPPARLLEAVEHLAHDWAQAEEERAEARGPGPGLADLLLTGLLIANGALTRQESRGGHYRTDFPRPRAPWRHHLDQRVQGAP